MSERESMPYDVVIVGAGPAGLSAAIRLKQLANEAGSELSVCILEKGSEVGAHILSGAVIDPRALDELLPEWRDQGCPLAEVPVNDNQHWILTKNKKFGLPEFISPGFMHNEGTYTGSLGNLCRWLAEQAEGLGVEIFPGFPAAEILYNEDGSVKGVATGDMGVARDGSHKADYAPGLELHAKYTFFAEGVRGHLTKMLKPQFALDADCEPQVYGLGVKELWDIDPEQHAAHINRIARITSSASVNFNNGLRAYYFALAALAWFLHPWLMIVATGWVVYVLYRREFRSKTLQALVEEDASPTLRR